MKGYWERDVEEERCKKSQAKRAGTLSAVVTQLRRALSFFCLLFSSCAYLVGEGLALAYAGPGGAYVWAAAAAAAVGVGVGGAVLQCAAEQAWNSAHPAAPEWGEKVQETQGQKNEYGSRPSFNGGAEPDSRPRQCA